MTARQELVTAVRELAAAAGRTDVSTDRMATAAAAIRRLTPTLEAAVLRGVPRIPPEVAAGQREYTWQVDNPAHPGLRVIFDEAGAVAELPGLGHLYEGPEGMVHGGVAAMLMDAVLSSLVQFHGIPCVTASLTLDYRRPTPLESPLTLTARLVDIGQRKVVASGEVRCGEETTIEVAGVFVRVGDRQK